LVPNKGVHSFIPLLCLLGMAAWTLFLVLMVGLWRGVEILLGVKTVLQYPSGTPHGSDRYWRLNRAHLNAVENLTVFGAIVVVGTLLGATGKVFSQLSVTYLIARICQSTTHVISGDAIAVCIRFTFWLTQILCCLVMLYHITCGISVGGEFSH